MLQKTYGIALKVTNYSENSVIAQVYTEELGLQAYLINGARKPKAKIHINLFQPLHLLDMVVYVKNNGALLRIKEAHASPAFQAIPFDITKSAVTMFLNEILYKVLKHQSPDPQLFKFIHQSIIWLDHAQTPIHNFHLCFLMKLSRFLGYTPSLNQNRKPFFDLVEGVFTNTAPAHTYVLQEPHTSLFHKILQSNYDESHTIIMNLPDRKYLLQQCVNFFKLHTENFGEINSLIIMEEIFN